MDNAILHVDCNKFYASVECCLHPEIKNKPVAVGGSEAARHGIILAKNEIAAGYGLATGEALWSARKKCPDLIVIPPHFSTYTRFSRMVRQILADYTDQIEGFGLDEAWMDLSDRAVDPVETAHKIRRRIKRELGITVSVGVSFTKTFAKLGSDYKKPDAVTVFSRENYRDLVWPLPAGELLYVGRSTQRKLAERCLFTIGDIARADPILLRSLLGKCGSMLHAMANGIDQPVCPGCGPSYAAAGVQSVSNGVTTPRDMEDAHDVKVILYWLAESVGRRLREQGFAGRTIEVHTRDNQLRTDSFQTSFPYYMQTTDDIAREAFALFCRQYRWRRPLRSISLGVTGLEPDSVPNQLEMLDDGGRDKREQLDKTVDELKKRFGDGCVHRAILLENTMLQNSSPYDRHTTLPNGLSGQSKKPY